MLRAVAACDVNTSSAEARRSRCPLTVAAFCKRATSVPVAVPTANITPNVIAWSSSATRNVKRGGMNQKL
jgi:hypothetical protein